MSSVGRALFRALKRKQLRMSSDMEHLLQPKYVTTLCHQLPDDMQDLFIRSAIAIAGAATPHARAAALSRCLRDEVRATAAPEVGFAALKALNWMDNRLHLRNSTAEGGGACPLDDVPFALEIGDVVVHRNHGHVGVIAERFAVTLMPDAWVMQNLGSMDSPMLQANWYTVLVDDRCIPQHPGFVRHGSELTHKVYDKDTGGGLQHVLLDKYFRGYDAQTRRFLPLHEPSSLEPFVMHLAHDVGVSRARLEGLFAGLSDGGAEDGP